VHGYYIEISRAQSANAPIEYTRRQTLKNAERFITPELKVFEDKALSAKSKSLSREKYLYEQLLERLNEDLIPLQNSAEALAELDVLATLAERADSLNWQAPNVEQRPGIVISQGRHPVVEKVSNDPFIANDLQLDQQRKMLIITGPQGAGNHMWAKIFSLHPEVFGWKTLLDNYWESHRYSEPFADHWKNVALLDDYDWSEYDYYTTSISVPLGIPNDDINPLYEPVLLNFSNKLNELGIEVQWAIVGRDQNILNHQQTRIRSESTVPLFLKQLPDLKDPIFLSYEMVNLYKEQYVKSLDTIVPIAWNDKRLHDIVKYDANAKYVHSIEHNELDNGNRFATVFKENPNK
jgi:hypothetical protein